MLLGTQLGKIGGKKTTSFFNEIAFLSICEVV
jgi:hypothetical protein